MLGSAVEGTTPQTPRRGMASQASGRLAGGSQRGKAPEVGKTASGKKSVVTAGLNDAADLLGELADEAAEGQDTVSPLMGAMVGGRVRGGKGGSPKKKASPKKKRRKKELFDMGMQNFLLDKVDTVKKTDNCMLDVSEVPGLGVDADEERQRRKEEKREKRSGLIDLGDVTNTKQISHPLLDNTQMMQENPEFLQNAKNLFNFFS